MEYIGRQATKKHEIAVQDSSVPFCPPPFTTLTVGEWVEHTHLEEKAAQKINAKDNDRPTHKNPSFP